MLNFPEPKKPWLLPIGIDPETSTYTMDAHATDAWHEGRERDRITEYATRYRCRYIRDINGYTVWDAEAKPVHAYQAAMRKYLDLRKQLEAADEEVKRRYVAMETYFLDEEAAERNAHEPDTEK